jgi:uncharacterized membrane protein YphA (DoxX/SURF4 family)
MKKLKNIGVWILRLAMCWLIIANFIQAFMCPEMTETQLFFHLPKSFICDFKACQ